MVKKALVPFMAALTALALLGCPNELISPADTVIDLSAIPGVTAPVTGAAPVTAITETTQYTGTVTWSGSPTSFAANTAYTATITLTAKTGYTLTGVAANFFTVADASSVANSADSGTVTAEFPATGAPAPVVVSIAAIHGVTAPVTGATPVTTITETAQYTGTVTWSPSVSDMFVSNTAYTATITLTAKTGYTLTGVAANTFTVTDAAATNSADSGVVAAVFTNTTANTDAVSDATSTNIGTLKAVQGGTFNNDTADMTVSSFRMSQYEITMEQFVAVTGLANPSTYFTSVTNGPVQYVTWYHALVFCNALSIKEGLTPVYTISSSTDPDDWGTVPTTTSTTWNAAIADWSANGYRLPTEAEWQFAARGGNISNSYTYAGSDTIDDVAWYGTNSSTTHTVGGKTANELGLYDMSGNVWELCWDWYAASYPASAQTDYRGAASGTRRVRRGGCWGNYASGCTVAFRNHDNPYVQSYNNGFRVVRP